MVRGKKNGASLNLTFSESKVKGSSISASKQPPFLMEQIDHVGFDDNGDKYEGNIATEFLHD